MANKKTEKTRRLRKKKKDKYERQLKIILILMLSLFLLVFLINLLIKQANKFKYLDLEFKKIRVGQILFYQAKFPLFDRNGNKVSYFLFNFRNNPKELEYIKINDNIRLRNNVVLAATPEILKCEDSTLSGGTLALYMRRIGLNPIPGSTNKTEAENLKIIYANCTNTTLYSIILSKKGNKSEITKQGNCYILNMENCQEVMKVTERFMLGIYADAMGIELENKKRELQNVSKLK